MYFRILNWAWKTAKNITHVVWHIPPLLSQPGSLLRSARYEMKRIPDTYRIGRWCHRYAGQGCIGHACTATQLWMILADPVRAVNVSPKSLEPCARWKEDGWEAFTLQLTLLTVALRKIGRARSARCLNCVESWSITFWDLRKQVLVDSLWRCYQWLTHHPSFTHCMKVWLTSRSRRIKHVREQQQASAAAKAKFREVEQVIIHWDVW